MSKNGNKGVAVVTGASMGIGAVYAERLARRGHDLLLVARDGARLAELAAKIEAETGQQAEVLTADLTNRKDLAAVEARLRDDAGIALLVNNAGILAAGPMAGADADAVERMLDLNVLALTRLTLAALPGFVARDEGAVIQIASVVPLLPERFANIYGSTKAYVLHFAQALQAELKDGPVRIQAVLPGATATKIWEKAGQPVETLPAEIVMSAEDMVDAALAGFDAGEAVTIPSLPDVGDWEAFTAARLKLAPNLSHNRPAPRYAVAAEAA